MQIILLETLNKLGKAGDIVTVKDGYAKNFLLPQKKAIVANKKNKETLESKMAEIDKNNKIKIDEASKIKSIIDGKKISIEIEANEDGNLYGNIGQKTVADKISSDFSVNLPSDSIVLGSIKKLGNHKISLRLYGDITAQLDIDILKKT